VLNNLVLVGRVSSEPQIRIFEDGAKVCNFDLAVDRPFKSQEGTKETDFFPITIWYSYADAVYQYCGVGSVIGVKGRLITRYQDVGGGKIKTVEIIGERVAFINAVRQKEKNDVNVQVDEEEKDINEKFEKEPKKRSKASEE